MIFFSVGLPSRFAEWCDVVTAALVTRALGTADLVAANSLEEIGRTLLRSDREHLVITSREMADDLRSCLTSAAIPFVLAVDDPRIAALNLVNAHNVDPVSAVRATATSSAVVLNTSAMDGVLLLRANHASIDPTATALAIADHLRLPLAPAAVAEVAASFPIVNGSGASKVAQDGLEPAWARMAAGALDAYHEYFGGHGMGEIVWTRDLFVCGDDPQQPATGVIDIAGEVRNLLFGPYIVLPPGYWHGTMTLAVSQEASTTPFSAEVLAGPRCALLAQTSFTPDARGVCRAAFSFTIDTSTDQPIALRVANTRPVQAGRLALGQVALQIQTETNAEIPAELVSALGP